MRQNQHIKKGQVMTKKVIDEIKDLLKAHGYEKESNEIIFIESIDFDEIQMNINFDEINLDMGFEDINLDLGFEDINLDELETVN